MSAMASLISAERAAGGDHALEVETAGPPQRDEAGNVAAAVAAAEERAHDLALADRHEHRRRQAQRLIEVARADEHRRAAVARRPDARLDRDGRADRVERVVDTDAAGERLHALDDVLRRSGRSRRSRRTAAPFSRALATGSDTMMRVAPGDARALHDRDPDAARADHEHRRAFGHACAVFSTAPTPVCTAHPITHTTSSGVSSGTLIAPRHRRDHVLGEARRHRRRATRARRDARAACGRRSALPIRSLALLTQQPYSPRTHQ